MTNEKRGGPAMESAARMEATHRRAMELCTSGDYAGLLKLEARERLGPKFFGSPTVLDLLENSIERIVNADREPTPAERAIFSHLTKLPIPRDFYERQGVNDQAVFIQYAAIAMADKGAIPVSVEIGLGSDLPNPAFYPAGITGAGRVLLAGDDAAYKDYERSFGLWETTMGPKELEKACCVLLDAGLVDETLAFARHFPRASLAMENSQGLFNAARNCARKVIADGDIEALSQVIDFAKPTEFQLQMILSACLEKIMDSGNEALLGHLRDRWKIPDADVADAAARAIRGIFNQNVGSIRETWDRAHAVSLMADLPRSRFDEIVVEGLTEGENATRRWNWLSGTDGFLVRVAEIRDLRNALPVDADVADRLERGAFVGVATASLSREEFGQMEQLCGLFPESADPSAIRKAAIASLKRASIVYNKWNVWQLNDWLKTRDIDPLGWDEFPSDIRSLVLNELKHYVPTRFLLLCKELEMTPEERSKVAAHLRKEAEQSMLSSTDLTEEHRAQLFDLYGFSWKTFPLEFIPLTTLVEATDPDLLARAEQDPWRASIAALLKLQARASNREHDPWRMELDPLVRFAVNVVGTLDRTSADDGRLLVEYVKAFGMLSLLDVSTVYFDLKHNPFSPVSDRSQSMITELVGKKAARMGSENLINEIRKLRFGMQTELLADRIPKKIATKIGKEIFQTLRGSTQWERGDSVTEIVEAWKETVARTDTSLETTAVAPGYEETAFSVAKASRREVDDEAGEREIDGLFSGEAGDAIAEALDEYYMQMLAAICNPRETTWRQLADYAWLDGRNRIEQDLAERSPEEYEQRLATHMEDTAARKPQTGETRRCLQALSALHLAAVAPSEWTNTLRAIYGVGDASTTMVISHFQLEYLREHYLNPAQVPEHVGHTPFSEKLRRALEEAWNAEGDENTNVILRTAARIESIHRSRIDTTAKGSIEVALVPVQGLLRIYAGDIGDACYTSQHDAMARGEFPNVRAMIFVTNRGKSNERMAGSVLFVETRMAESNERVLVIRANNPRQNLIAQVDADSLVRHTVDAAIKTAKRRGIKHVAVVRDRVTAASSNRERVSAHYQSNYEHNMAARLVDEPATNFNGYNVWDETAGHPSVIVWTNDDPEAT